MKKPEDPIEVQAYTELIISCQVEGCIEELTDSINNAVQDPVEKWAVSMAKKARLCGWSSNCEGLVVCPTHSSN